MSVEVKRYVIAMNIQFLNIRKKISNVTPHKISHLRIMHSVEYVPTIITFLRETSKNSEIHISALSKRRIDEDCYVSQLKIRKSVIINYKMINNVLITVNHTN